MFPSSAVKGSGEDGRQVPAVETPLPKTARVYPVFDLRNFLEGRWCVSRLFVDRDERNRGTFSGIACFLETSTGGLAYREEGHMRYGDYNGVASRCYLYSFPSAYLANVYFADGRLFHDLDLREGDWQSMHVCGEDRYRGRIWAWSHDRWELQWEVLGPHKDLEIVSRYVRRSGRAVIAV